MIHSSIIFLFKFNFTSYLFVLYNQDNYHLISPIFEYIIHEKYVYYYNQDLLSFIFYHLLNYPYKSNIFHLYPIFYYCYKILLSCIITLLFLKTSILLFIFTIFYRSDLLNKKLKEALEELGLQKLRIEALLFLGQPLK